MVRPIHWLLVRTYLRVRVIHPERVPATGPVIFVPTHRSRWDAIVLQCLTRRLLRHVVSHDEFVWPQGWVMRHLGAFSLDTQRPTPALMRHCQDVLLGGEPLTVFPEGTIFYYPRRHVHPLKPGAAWLALGCQRHMPGTSIPVLPVRIVYSDRYPRFRTLVQLEVGDPIDARVHLVKPHKEAIRSLTADLQRALGDVVDESLAEMSPPRNPSAHGPACARTFSRPEGFDSPSR
ncbi:MAG: 1-acyl-sn-glycerol-3-phosphate acyltransferase [Isosphaeraceae bacterium]|nr:1-acyl-sn-glycerol-3-phosphate acyltransferase [Isosphaeraceae bacterium]